MGKDFSPEERLLRLIKKSKKKEATKTEEAVKLPEATSRPAEKSARALSIALPIPLKEFNTRVLNPILIIILVGLILYFAYDLFYTSYCAKEVDIFAENGKIPKIESDQDIPEIKPYSYYSSIIEGRNVFLPQQIEIETVITGPTVEEISANLSLIGIIAGERPQAIIEDKKSGKSHFLYKGGLVGKAKIVDILKDSVIMGYQGETYELVL